ARGGRAAGGPRGAPGAAPRGATAPRAKRGVSPSSSVRCMSHPTPRSGPLRRAPAREAARSGEHHRGKRPDPATASARPRRRPANSSSSVPRRKAPRTRRGRAAKAAKRRKPTAARATNAAERQSRALEAGGSHPGRVRLLLREERREGLPVQRPREEVALGAVAAELAQALQLDLALDALGDDLQAEGAGDLDDRRDDGGVLVLGADAVDEGAV